MHPHVLIVGGGIAGAALALFLHKTGISSASCGTNKPVMSRCLHASSRKGGAAQSASLPRRAGAAMGSKPSLPHPHGCATG